ncbi:tRNA-specific adenosine deaminase monomer [Buchnera aphidicola str. Ak (Acyrthosiphon kondoi)]|jgi:tRNA(adenine34) deaminase|uniref:tRNA-specific adenosine deaminase n=1 Tax=Buchnera aphidicola str. Ak (Acyrthosiphon kondoi) TaxID=1005090 RepID=G2LMX0_9GAMM|nr:tRNA adenosine(34) deaminase TadA [Buchnera aphidicola]AEO08608.1 tRNA-specific adenosine deaminase monomer [Buchnera aphidicola str. Ak (Acyrthosiphon kondoi)]
MRYKKDKHWMTIALKYAYYAKEKGEIPIGAVLVFKERIIGIGWNKSIATNDPTAHAEIIALRHAGKNIKNYRLLNTTLYVTLQPCIMCCGAIIHSRIKRLVFGTNCEKVDAKFSFKNIFFDSQKHYNLDIKKNVMKRECSNILIDFFKKKRKK